MAYTSRTYWSTTTNPYYQTYVEPPPSTTTETGWQRMFNTSQLIRKNEMSQIVVNPKKKDIEIDPAVLLDFLSE